MAGWTDSETAVLKDLTAQGYSASQIAPFVGRTRNAVIGKWERMGDGVSARGTHSPWNDDTNKTLRKMWIDGHTASQIADKLCMSLGAVQGKIVRMQKKTSKRRFFNKMSPLVALKKEKLPKQLAPAIGPTVKFPDHKDSQCKYIDGDPDGANTLFCANDRMDGVPYCAGHAQMCYTPVVRRPHRPFLLTPSNPALAAHPGKS